MIGVPACVRIADLLCRLKTFPQERGLGACERRKGRDKIGKHRISILVRQGLFDSRHERQAGEGCSDGDRAGEGSRVP